MGRAVLIIDTDRAGISATVPMTDDEYEELITRLRSKSDDPNRSEVECLQDAVSVLIKNT